MLALIEPAYLAAQTPHAQSGKGGDVTAWEYARRLVCDAIHSDGTFLDIGCANGLLMDDIQRWAAADGYAIEPHGVDISAKLADLARGRYPQWADRIHTANANGFARPTSCRVSRGITRALIQAAAAGGRAEVVRPTYRDYFAGEAARALPDPKE